MNRLDRRKVSRRGAARLLAAAVLIAACDHPPVAWSDPTELAAPPGPSRLELDGAGRPTLVADTPIAPAINAIGICPASVRVARGRATWQAAWWSQRGDSGTDLYGAHSADSGRTWSAPALIDSSRVDGHGCDRPPPAVTTVGDDLYVAYSLVASEGTGVFFAHFMDGMFHSPVAVIYGERLVPTAIAVQGDRVAVAYAEPNGARQQVDLALSSTDGHIFEYHTTASRDVDVASAPEVTLRGNTIAVAWTTKTPTDTLGARIVRVGRWP